jgi:hypothetical protein
MMDAADAQAPLEAVLKDEIIRMYEEVADNPEGEFHFYHGREAAERFGYAPEWLDRAPPGSGIHTSVRSCNQASECSISGAGPGLTRSSPPGESPRQGVSSA